jgi:hypothetical protein
MAEQSEFQQEFFISSADFTIVSAEGISDNANDSFASLLCVPESEMLPSAIGPGQSVRGKVILDSPHSSGSLVYSPIDVAPGGWEWGF